MHFTWKQYFRTNMFEIHQGQCSLRSGSFFFSPFLSFQGCKIYVVLCLLYFVTKEFPFELWYSIQSPSESVINSSQSLQYSDVIQCMHKLCYCLTESRGCGLQHRASATYFCFTAQQKRHRLFLVFWILKSILLIF